MHGSSIGTDVAGSITGLAGGTKQLEGHSEKYYDED